MDKELFSNTLPDNVIDKIMQEIALDLYDAWYDSILDEGEEYAEWKFFYSAPDEIKKAYNEYYELKPDDEYYLEVD